jgi:HSP20 family protein
MRRYAPGAEFWAEPLASLRRIQEEMNRALGEVGWAPPGEYPPVNIWRGEDGVTVTAEVPGVPLEAIELTVHQNTLTIKGRREPEAKEPAVSFHRRERSYGSFARTVPLPFNVDADRVVARAENGILTVILPRPETDKPRRIHITRG